MFFRTLKKKWLRRQLKDEQFSFLFDDEVANEYICFDLETTSLDIKTAQILSIGAVHIRDQRVIASQKISLSIKTNARFHKFDHSAIKVHHIREKDAQNGITVEEGIYQLLRFIGSRPIVGYYLEFDMAILNRHCQELIGCTLPHRQIDISSLYYDWRNQKFLGANIDLSFDKILKNLDVPSLPAHNALNDALMSALCFLKLKHKL